MLGSVLLIIIVVIVIFPVAWLISEFKTNKRSIRITLGILAISCVWGVGYLAAQLVRLNYNIWYSSAATKLISTIVSKLEKGETDSVISNLKELGTKLEKESTYETRGNFDELAKQAVENMNKEKIKNNYNSEEI